ncbi:MAG: hypothetical protein ACJ0QS_03920 [Parvicellaceae bacterium]
MKKYLHIVLIFTLIPAFYNAQYYNRNTYKTKRHEISFGLGASSCLTDVGGGKSVDSSLFGGSARGFLFDMNIKKTKYVANFSYTYYLKSKLSFRLNLAYSQISGDDKESGDIHRQNRRLNFETTIVEGSGVFEWIIIPEKIGNRYNLKNKFGKKIGGRNQLFGLYAFAGIGGFYYDPWGYDKFLQRGSSGDVGGIPERHRLRPLRTEGQGVLEPNADNYPDIYNNKDEVIATYKDYAFPLGDSYTDFAVCVPVGFGIRKSFHSTAGLKLEASYRFTNTDYLDDVSTNYFDRIELEEYFGNNDLGPIAANMSGTQTGETYLYIGYATELDIYGEPIYPDGAEKAPQLGGTNPYTLTKTRTEPGFKRGNPEYKDSYMFLTLSVYKKLTNTPKTMKIANSSSKRRIKASF